MSTARTQGIAVESIIGFVAGAYLALYLVPATVDWGQPFESRLVLAALRSSTVLAIFGGSWSPPTVRAMWAPMAIAASGVGVVSAVVLLIVEADPVALILAGLLETSAITFGARRAV